MVQQLSITDLVRNFSDYINRVFYKKEHFVVLKGNRPVAELRPLPEARTLGDLFSVLGQQHRLSDEEAETFMDDLKDIREEMNSLPLRDPWDS